MFKSKKKFVVVVSAVATLLVMLTSCNEKNVPKKSVEMKTYKDSLSYTFGVDMGNYLKSAGQKINVDIFADAVKSVLDGKDLKLTAEQMTAIQEKMREDMMKKSEEASSMNKEFGSKFLEENKKKEGVKVTESGLQYEILKEGTGLKPTIEHTVKVHYTGTTLDGKVFDSSVERGTPAEFPLNGVIKGWTEGLQLMKVGAKYKFYIPSELAYGERGAGAMIEPNSALIFEVELLEIVK